MYYNCVIPKLGSTGPVIIALQLCEYFQECGFKVQIFTLDESFVSHYSGIPVRKFKFIDFINLKGIVHSHTFRPDCINALVKILRRTAVVSVTTVHSYFYDALVLDHSKFKVLAAYCLWKHSVRKLDQVVFISRSMERYYRLRKLYLKRTAVIYNWRDLLPKKEKCKPKEKYGEKVSLIFCGTLDERKNIRKLVDKVILNKNFHLTILGDGPYREWLVAMSEQYSNISYLGRKDDIRPYFMEADLLVLPSYAEGLPTVAIEAAQLGVPSLLSNISVHRELQSIGIAKVFDHNCFDDFDKKVAETIKLRDFEIIESWKAYFSRGVCGANYVRAIEGSNCEKHKK